MLALKSAAVVLSCKSGCLRLTQIGGDDVCHAKSGHLCDVCYAKSGHLCTNEIGGGDVCSTKSGHSQVEDKFIKKRR